MNLKRWLFIWAGSVPIVLLVLSGQTFLAVLIGLLVIACCLFVPALQSAKPEIAQEAKPVDARF